MASERADRAVDSPPADGIRAVPLAAVSLALASLATGFVSLRQNRLAAALPRQLWSVVSVPAVAVYLALLAGILAATLAARGRRDALPVFACGLLADGLIVAVLLLAESAARRLLAPGGALERVSLGPGAWLSALAAYVVVLDSLRQLEARPGLRTAVSAAPIAAVVLLAVAGAFRDLSLAKELATRGAQLASQVGSHLALSLAATGIAVLVGLPLGVLAYRRRGAEKPVFLVVNTVQTIPGLALFGLLIAPLAALSHRFPALRRLGIEGIGAAPALIALTLYALLPIARNAHAGLRSLERAALEAGRGMGMSGWQLLASVEVPLALPVVLSGVRTALVQAIGNASIAALIGAGGLGIVIFQGLGQAAPDLILLGTIPVIALAVIADRLMEALVRLATPRGMRGTGGLP